MKHKVEFSGFPKAIPAFLLEEGQYGIVTETYAEQFNKYIGHVLLMSYARHLVSLTSPCSTWNGPDKDFPAVGVRLLKPGEQLTITIGE